MAKMKDCCLSSPHWIDEHSMSAHNMIHLRGFKKEQVDKWIEADWAVEDTNGNC